MSFPSSFDPNPIPDLPGLVMKASFWPGICSEIAEHGKN